MKICPPNSTFRDISLNSTSLSTFGLAYKLQSTFVGKEKVVGLDHEGVFIEEYIIVLGKILENPFRDFNL